MNIVIAAGDIDGNLGDRAILAATRDMVHRIDPAARVHTVSADPARTENDLGVSASARGLAGFIDLLREAARADAVLIGGGGLFQDDDSLVKMPYWAARTMALRAANRRIIGWSLGVGPLGHASSRVAARLAFKMMTGLSVRDERARATARPLTSLPVAMVPDPAICLEPAPASEIASLFAREGIDPDRRPIVGVALRRWFPPRPRLVPRVIASRIGLADPNEEALGDTLAVRVAKGLASFLERRGGQIVFLPSYDRAHEGDVSLAATVRARLPAGSAAILRIDGPRLYKAVCGRLDLMVGGRMHPTILASGIGTPVCGLAYNPKFQGFFDLIGRGDLVIDIADLVLGSEGTRLPDLMESALDAGPPSPERVAGLCAQVEAVLRDQLAACSRAAGAALAGRSP